MCLDKISQQYSFLEDEILGLNYYITIDKKNYDAFGYRIYELFFQSCNLFEKLSKNLCDKSRCNGEGCGIAHWREVPLIMKLHDYPVVFIPTDDTIQPLMNFHEHTKNNVQLKWWDDYNQVKHNIGKLEKATLMNLIHALSADIILLTHYQQSKFGKYNHTFKESKLFERQKYYLCFKKD